MMAQIVTTGMSTDSIPTARPVIMTVAGPVSPALAMFRIGLPPV